MDVVCFYADLGRPYEPLIERMTRSAKAIIPDCRTVLLTPRAPPAVIDLFDVAVELRGDATVANLCLERARATVTWGAMTETRTIFADPDIEFLKPPPFDGTFDLGFLWRTKADQPINTGVILVEPGQEKFWAHYGAAVANLPSVLHRWYCDQLAFSLMTGICHKADDRLEIEGSRIWLMDAKNHCYKPQDITENAWAVHRKGATKGPGWDQIFTSRKTQPGVPSNMEKSGAGMSSAASV